MSRWTVTTENAGRDRREERLRDRGVDQDAVQPAVQDPRGLHEIGPEREGERHMVLASVLESDTEQAEERIARDELSLQLDPVGRWLGQKRPVGTRRARLHQRSSVAAGWAPERRMIFCLVRTSSSRGA